MTDDHRSRSPSGCGVCGSAPARGVGDIPGRASAVAKRVLAGIEDAFENGLDEFPGQEIDVPNPDVPGPDTGIQNISEDDDLPDSGGDPRGENVSLEEIAKNAMQNK